MAAPLVFNSVNKTPYVLLERLGDDVRAPRGHAQRIPLSDRNPVVLLERLPLGFPVENGEEGGENRGREMTPPPVPSASQAGGQDSRKDGHKRPCSTPSSGTPTKRVRFNSASSGGLSARRKLWTRLQHESIAPILRADSSATKENLSVLLGVKSSRGVPIVSLERLELGAGDMLAGASTGHSPTSSHDEDADIEEEPSSPSSKSGEALGPRQHAAAATCSFQQMDSSDDNCGRCCKFCKQLLHEVREAVLPSSSIQESDLLQRPEFLADSSEDQPACRASEIQLYDQSEHLMPVDSPKTIFSNGLYLAARVAPVWDEEGPGVLCNDIGPLTSWWLTGYGAGEKPVIGVSTELADYYIQGAHAVYVDFFKPLHRKMHLCKLVVDAVNDDPSCSYESLIQLIQDAAVPGLDEEQGEGGFTEEELLRHGSFVVQQACSHDAARDRDEEPTALTAPCIQQLVNLCRVTRLHGDPDSPLKRYSRPRASLATCTPLVEDVFRQQFASQLANGKEEGSSHGHTETRGRQVCRSCRGWKGKHQPVVPGARSVSWCGRTEDSGTGTVHTAVEIGGRQINRGDFVLAHRPGRCCPRVGYVMQFFDGQADEKMAHIQWFLSSCETILGSFGDPSIIYLACECEDIPVDIIISACKVQRRVFFEDWYEEGGKLSPSSAVEGDFTFAQLYFPETGRFEDAPALTAQAGGMRGHSCYSCRHKAKKEMAEQWELRGAISQNSKGDVLYASLRWRQKTYLVGSCVFLTPGSVKLAAGRQESPGRASRAKKKQREPFHVARILSITGRSAAHEASIRVGLFYRPEDTSLNQDMVTTEGLNVLYYSNEEADVGVTDICGKARVVFSESGQLSSQGVWSVGDVFVFSDMYSGRTQEFFDVPDEFRCIGQENTRDERKQEKPRLRALEVFAGCGGLSYGLEAVGASSPLWAVENCQLASRAYQRNFPNTTLFVQDCNQFLSDILAGKKTNSAGQVLPQKGDVELLCGGPPCQGFSKLNRFQSSEPSMAKSALVSTYLSVCDYYRPQLFLLENVAGFLSSHGGHMLPLTLLALLRMGYQCAFTLLQAALYGLPQSRSRLIIIAAAPGQVLPRFPEPKTSYSALSFTVNGQEYTAGTRWTSHAPMRAITLYDAISDLAEVEPKGGADDSLTEPSTHYQLMLKGSSKGGVRDHELPTLSPLMQARVDRIPRFPGANWKHLPNDRVRLSDGTYTDTLVWKTYSGGVCGVCACAAGHECSSPPSKRFRTLIPWSLVHAFGSRVLPIEKKSKLGVPYSRLRWDTCARTLTTKLSPVKSSVLHPSQSRVLSVRECARIQGFPDDFVFVGSVDDKLTQVGNAVPPPLAAAIGQEIVRSLRGLSLHGTAGADRDAPPSLCPTTATTSI